MRVVKAQQYQSNYHRFDIDVNSRDKVWLFNTSDWHFDNPKCNRELLFKHLDEALEKNALITVTGDLLCLMQGRYDPRRNKSAIRPEHNKDNYLDLVIKDTAEKLRKYAKNIILITKGNHETSVSLRMETDITTRLVERLNTLENTISSHKKQFFSFYSFRH